MEQEDNSQLHDFDPQLHEFIEAHFEKLKSDLCEFLENNLQNLQNEQNDLFTNKIEKLKKELEDEKNHFDEMHSGAGEKMQILVRKQAILNNLIEMCSKLHQKLRDGNTRSRYFNTWVQMGTDKEVLYEAFHSIYIERAIERLFFRRWNRLMHKKRLRRLESRIRKRYSSILKTKEEESLQIIQDLEAELATAKSELQKSQENFNQMQDRLKKAFLRGVVNLNIEAMDAFDGAPFANENSEVESQSTIEDDFIDYDDDDDDDDFYVEDVPSVSVIKHQ